MLRLIQSFPALFLYTLSFLIKFPVLDNSYTALAYLGFKGEISQSLAYHQKHAPHVDIGCSALKRNQEFGGIVAKSRDY